MSGAALGLILEFVALIAAFFSAGAGHGDYVAVRALFPVPMLMTLAQGDVIGVPSLGVALVQFPLYGGLLGWTFLRKVYLPALLVGSLHVAAAIACFAGVLPNFS